MFDNNYNCEKAIKKIAKFWNVFSYVTLGISIIAALIPLIDFDEFFIVTIVAAGCAIGSIFGVLASHFMWGLGELVGNSQKKPEKPDVVVMETEIDSLPEL